jgi:hypothetical protein
MRVDVVDPVSMRSDIVIRLKPGVYSKGLNVPVGTVVQGGPGVIFDGRRKVTNWKVSGDLRYISYKRIPVEKGHGIDFPNGQNCRQYVCRFADQVWSGTQLLKQVTKKEYVRSGRFWVGDGQLWIHKDNIKDTKVSSRRVWGNVAGTLRDVTIIGYSANAADRAVLRVEGGTLKNVIVKDSSMVAIQTVGNGSKLENVVIDRSGWMGIGSVLCKNTLLDTVTIKRINLHKEYSNTPQSGALKTSRCINTTIVNSKVDRVVGHGLWFDQSTINTLIRNTKVTRVSGRAIFYEISHKLRMYDSYMSSDKESRFVGASSSIVTNTTFVPKYLILKDKRTCPDPRTPLCYGALRSDRLPINIWDSLSLKNRPTWRNSVIVNP